MNDRALPHPTDGELAILHVLWKLGPSTVRQVHEALATERRTAYTTTLKLLQIMTDKGLVRRDESERSHVYAPQLSEQETQRRLIRSLAERAFDGSMSKLLIRAVEHGKLSREELEEMQHLIDSRRKQPRG